MKNPPAETEIKTLRELLPGFYQQYELGNDGGQSSAHVKIELTKKIFLYFPNFSARRKAILKHDVHHIATGYTSTLKGETEIGAWEIASGCRHYWVAFVLDLQAMMIGLLINPAGMYRAFIKGRQTKNLYADPFTDKQLMDIPLYRIKEYLLLNNFTENKKKASLRDAVSFLLILLVGALNSILSLLLLPFVLVYTLYVVVQNRK